MEMILLLTIKIMYNIMHAVSHIFVKAVLLCFVSSGEGFDLRLCYMIYTWTTYGFSLSTTPFQTFQSQSFQTGKNVMRNERDDFESYNKICIQVSAQLFAAVTFHRYILLATSWRVSVLYDWFG